MQCKCLVLLQQVLRELQSQHRCLLSQLAQALFASSIQQCTATHKSVVAVVQQHLLLGRQLAVMQVHVLNAFKQFLVQTYIVGMLGQYRTHLLCQRIHIVVGLGRQKIKEHRRHATQQIVVSILILLVVNTDDGIVEGWLIGIIDNLLYLLVVTTYSLQHSLLVILHTDTVKGSCVVRCVITFEKRVRSLNIFVLVHTNFFLSSFSPQSYDKIPILSKSIH